MKQPKIGLKPLEYGFREMQRDSQRALREYRDRKLRKAGVEIKNTTGEALVSAFVTLMFPALVVSAMLA